MHFRDFTRPITLDTPLPIAPSPTERKKRYRTETIDLDEDWVFDGDNAEAPATSSETAPAISGSLTSPPSSTPVPPPPVSSSATPTSTTSTCPPRTSEVAVILPILSVPPNHKVNLQTLFPFLPDTFLGLLNHVVQIQNQSLESVFRALGQGPRVPFPTFDHPYRPTTSTPPPRTQRVTFVDPPVVSTTIPAATIPVSAPFVTPEMLIASLSAAAVQTASTTEPALREVSHLVSGIASTSDTHDDSDPKVEELVMEREGVASAH